MALVRFALKNPHFIFVLVVATITLGVVSYLRLPKDLLPLFKTPAVQILTLYPGMPAEVVEKDMTSRLERWTGQANGIERQESRSMLGVSIVRDYFRSDIDPNTALSQVTSLAMSDLYYLPPGTIPPMVMPFDPTATVPLVLLAISGEGFDETKLYDIAYFDLRNRLQGITGVIAPAVYGGRLRRILTYVEPDKLNAFNLSLTDIVRTLRDFNTLIPAGNMKIGDKDYQIVSNGLVEKVDEMNDFPIRSSLQGGEVLISEVGKTEDSAQIQTNVVHVNGKRQVYIPVYRQPGANTIAVVDAIRDSIKSILARLPAGIRIDLVADQSEYVRHAIKSLSLETIQGAILAVLVIWLFLGHLQTALVTALAIPISIFFTFIGFLVTGDTLNAMTLGGLALVIGRLVDDSIVVTENIERHRRDIQAGDKASLHGAAEVTMPVLAATITTIIVFVPVFFLQGISAFLFAPLARSVALSIAASFVVAMTVIPILLSRMPIREFTDRRPFQRAFDRIQGKYRELLPYVLHVRKTVFIVCIALMGLTALLYHFVGKDLFPSQDVGHLTIKVRLPSGTRIEKTEERIKAITEDVRKAIPENEVKTIIANMGVLYDWPAAYTPNAGPQDAFLEVQLTEAQSNSSHHYANILRRTLPQRHPDTEFVIDTESIMTAALTFGLPSPINVQVTGNDLHVSEKLGKDLIERIRGIRGLVDLRIQQRLDYPQVTIDVDRRKAAAMGLTAVDIVKNVVAATNSSVNFDPAFWIDSKNGNHYFVGTQYREKDLVDEDSLKSLLITSKQQERAIPLKELARFGRTTAPTEINHLNIGRVLDVYGNVSGRDLASVSAEIEKQIAQMQTPPGYQVHMRGEMSFLRDSFKNLSQGFLLAVFLIYLVLVAQFRSLKDPIIILIAVPLGLLGVMTALWVTGSTLNIQSFLGIIFMAGIVVSNSILIVEFTNHKMREEKLPLEQAIIEASTIRLRPIIMTSLAAIVGLLPMAIGIGRGSEPNVPLARAVIGGLLVSTFLSLLVVPCLYFAFNNPKSKSRRSLGAITNVIAIPLLFFFSGIGSPKFALAATGQVVSFADALQFAKTHHPLLKASQARVSGQTAAVRSVQSNYWPRIQGSAVISDGISGATSGLGMPALSNSAFRKGYGASIDLEQMIYDFGRTSNQVVADLFRLSEFRGAEAVTMQKILINVVRAYLECQQLTRHVATYKKANGDLAGLAKEIKRFTRTRQRSPVDLSLVEVSLHETEANLVTAQQNQEIAQGNLNYAVGAAPNETVHCDQLSGPTEPIAREADQLVKIAEDLRPELKQVKYSLARAEAEKDVARSQYFPKIVALASVGQLEDANLLPKKNYVVGLGVKIPFFDGFKTPAEVERAGWEVERLTQEGQELRNQIRAEVERMFREYRRTQLLTPILAARRKEATRALSLAVQRYTTKSGLLSEWDQAYRAWVQSELAYWNLDFEHKLAAAGLQLATGDLNAK